MATRDLIVLGAGGHAREIAFLARQSLSSAELSLACFAVDDGTERGELDGLPVLALSSAAKSFPGGLFVAGIGSPGNRKTAAAAASELGLLPTTLVHRSAIVAPDLRLGDGVLIFPNAVVSVGVTIGDHTHLNFGSSVSHDCTIGDYATVSPGARIAGNVRISNSVVIGIGASVMHGYPDAQRQIGEGAVVGAQACVLRDVPPGAVVAGVPARPLPTR